MRTCRICHTVCQLSSFCRTLHPQDLFILHAWDFGDYLIQDEHDLKRREEICSLVLVHWSSLTPWKAGKEPVKTQSLLHQPVLKNQRRERSFLLRGLAEGTGWGQQNQVGLHGGAEPHTTRRVPPGHPGWRVDFRPGQGPNCVWGYTLLFHPEYHSTWYSWSRGYKGARPEISSSGFTMYTMWTSSSTLWPSPVELRS